MRMTTLETTVAGINVNAGVVAQLQTDLTAVTTRVTTLETTVTAINAADPVVVAQLQTDLTALTAKQAATCAKVRIISYTFMIYTLTETSSKNY